MKVNYNGKKVYSGDSTDLLDLAGKLSTDLGQAVKESDLVIEYSPEELAAQVDAVKNKGELYAETGVTVPFTSKDAVGLLQIKSAFELGAEQTVMVFTNGERLPLTPDTFPDFAAWFVQKRNSFYIS